MKKPSTAARRAAILAKLAPDILWATDDINRLSYSGTLAIVTGLNHAATLRLAVGASTALGVQLGDSGPLSLDVLKQVAFARLCRIAINGDQATHDAVLTQARSDSPKPPRTPARRLPVVPATPAAPDATDPPVAPSVPVRKPVAVALDPKREKDRAYWAARSPAMVAYATSGEWHPAADVFNLPSIKGWVQTFSGAVGAPAVDADYVLNESIVQEMVDNLSRRVPRHTWVWGERGSGKTTLAEQIAARLGRPFFNVTFCRTTDPSEVIGDIGLQTGNTGWTDGTILLAVRSSVPPIILLDEITQAVAESITGPLNEIIHPRCCYRVPKTGEIVSFDPRTFFIAADNTNGTGDSTGRFTGTRMQNAALRDRFGSCIRLDFLPMDEEIRIIASRAEVSDAIARKAYNVMRVLREKVQQGILADPPSMRECIAFAGKLDTGMVTPAEAFDRTFAQKAPVEAQETMRSTFLSIWQ